MGGLKERSTGSISGGCASQERELAEKTRRRTQRTLARRDAPRPLRRVERVVRCLLDRTSASGPVVAVVTQRGHRRGTAPNEDQGSAGCGEEELRARRSLKRHIIPCFSLLISTSVCLGVEYLPIRGQLRDCSASFWQPDNQ